MGSMGLLLLLVGAFIIYEAARSLTGSVHVADAASSGGAPGGMGPSGSAAPAAGPQSSSDYATLAQQHSARTGIPARVYLAIIENESSASSRAQNALFGIQGSGFPYTDYHPTAAGGRSYYQSQLQTYPTAEAAFSGFDRFIQVGRYVPSWNYLQQSHDWRGWLQRLNQAGYAELQTWYQTIISRAGG